MVASTDFSLSRIQVAAFLVGDEMRPSQALRHILASLPDVYDGETMSLPLAADAPPDLPSVILSNRERTEELQIARTRVIITWIAPDEDQPQVPSILEVLGTRLADVLDGTRVAAGRLGIIATRSTAIAQP